MTEDAAVSDEAMQQWIHVLAELEKQLTENNPTALAWTLPRGLGGIPEALRDRANRLAAAQSAAIAALKESLTQTAAELATAAPARQPTSSVYLDVMG